jgi:hypothetical protein
MTNSILPDTFFPGMITSELSLKSSQKDKKNPCQKLQKTFATQIDPIKHNIKDGHNQLSQINFDTIDPLPNNVSNDHEKVKTFPCAVCHKTFLVEDDLEWHLTHSHDTNNYFQCLVCAKLFGTNNDLNTHLTSTHHWLKEP